MSKTMSSAVYLVAWFCCLLAGGCELEVPPSNKHTSTEGLVGMSVSTDAAFYVLNQPVVVTWAGLPGNDKDWIAYAPAGSTDTTVTRWVYTGGATTGSATLEGTLAGGSYVARAFIDDTYSKVAEGTTFTVNDVVTVSADMMSYAPGQSITVSWANLPGNPNDWIAVAPMGSPDTVITHWVYTAGVKTGQATLDGVITTGSYVARAFVNNSYAKVRQSASFAVDDSLIAVAIPAFAQSPIGLLALYEGPDGEVINLRVEVNCLVAKEAIQLCAWETDDPRNTHPQVCNSTSCIGGDIIELTIPTHFVSGPTSIVTVLVTDFSNGFSEYSVLSAEATVQPGVIL